jgi:hypothetical protein
MYYECKSAQTVGRLLKMSRSNAVRWIKERAAKLPGPDPQAAGNNPPIEVIGLWTLHALI